MLDCQTPNRHQNQVLLILPNFTPILATANSTPLSERHRKLQHPGDSILETGERQSRISTLVGQVNKRGHSLRGIPQLGAEYKGRENKRPILEAPVSSHGPPIGSAIPRR